MKKQNKKTKQQKQTFGGLEGNAGKPCVRGSGRDEAIGL